MDPILYVVLALVALGGVIAWVVTSRREALPPAQAPAQLPPVRARGEPDGDTDAGDELEPDTIVGEDLGDAIAEPIASAPVPVPEPRDEAIARPSRARTFTPPPRPGAQAQPAVTVPLPVEKPRAATPRDRGRGAVDDAARFREGLAKTRGGFVDKLARLFRGKPKVDAALRDKVEEVLFTADIGTTTANKLLERVTDTLDKKEVADPDAVWAVIRQACLEILTIDTIDTKDAAPPSYDVTPRPYVLLAIGVNGVGKTTTLGKLAARHVAEGRKVLLVAGDTFRAAAVEQLDVWARRVGCELHKGAPKADPSSVIYEGIARGRREGFDVVLCDTAGRLHTKKELMDELAKVGRAAGKALAAGTGQAAAADAGAHDIFLVLDATIGQNALAQAQMFKETMRFTGLVVTKLDGTAKGGVVLGICDELRIPIRYVGIGEGVEDLREFSPEAFTTALLDA